MKRVCIAGIVALAIGCRGREPEPTQPFELAGAKILKPGEVPRGPSELPKLVVTLRGGFGVIKAGDKIPCDVTLTVPSERLMPGGVVLELLQKDRIFDTREAVPHKDAGGGVYVLRGELAAPKKAGRYQVRATATDAEIRQVAKDADPEITPFLTKSPPIEVEVRP